MKKAASVTALALDGSGSYVAEVQDLALLGYFWDLDMGYPGDEDGDGLPDNTVEL